MKQLLPRLLILLSENELPFLLEWDIEFRNTLHEKGFINFKDYTMEGHNHISPNFALSSGEGEDWGKEVVTWMKS